MTKLNKEQKKRIVAHKRQKDQEEEEKANQEYLMSTMGECPECVGKSIERDIRWLKCLKCGYILKR